MWDLVRELRDEGVAVLLTTHLMDEAEDLADQVVVVDHGRVIAQGSVPSLVAVRRRPAPCASRRPAGWTSAPRWAPASSSPSRAPASYTVTGAVDPRAVAALTGWLAEQDVLVTQLSVGRRTLEDVFLDLTGRNLR